MRIGMIVWLLCCVMQVKAFTAIESYQHQLKGRINKGDILIVKDEKFLNNAFDWTKIHNKAVSNIITFGLYRDAGVVLSQAFKCQADLKIEYWAQPDQVDPLIIDHVKLDIGYDPAKGVAYQESATYRFLHGHRVRITVNDITSAELGSNLPAAFQLTAQIAVERWYDLETDKKVVPKVIAAATPGQLSNTVALSWDKITGAEEYDLEWTFIDEESANGRALTTAGSGITVAALAKMFRNNATRVTLQQEYYNISLVHFSKYLLLRARTVMYNAEGFRQQGEWNYEVEKAGVTGPAVIALDNEWHLPGFNWQYSAVYAEEGKKKEVVSYFDGSLRTRQTVTVNNSDQKAVVQESVYDEFGRPLASILPAPIPETDLKYYKGLHLNSTGANYNFNNAYGTGTNCINVPEPLGTGNLPDASSGGAGQYYSPLSKFVSTAPYIPDAGGYPFAVTRYTPDNTGRVSVQGGVGAIFQPGNKANRYYYGKPNQWELDRLFGNDVGFAAHYLKNMVMDANGQISISYQNASGKTIATALAGKGALNVDSLVSKAVAKTETFTLLEPGDYSFDPSKLKLSASTTYMNAVPGDVRLVYNVEKLIRTFSVKGVTMCSNCYYELYIRVTDNCNNTLFNTASPIPIGSLTSDCNNTTPATGNIDVTFGQVGEYYISFELGIPQEALTAFTEDYVKRNTSLLSEYSYISNAIGQAQTLGCFNDCSSCKEALGTKQNYTYQVKKHLAELGVDTIVNRSSLTGLLQGLYDVQLNICASLRNTCQPSPCQELENAIKKDVSPGGQYALFDANNLPLEKNIHVLFQHWREVFPEKGPADIDYVKLRFTVENGDSTSPYGKSFTLDSLVKYWNPEWAIKFAPFHPEYCALRFCNDNNTYLQWDEKLKNVAVSIADIPTVVSGATYKSSLTWLIDKDPFLIANTTRYNAFKADLDNYSSNIARITNTTLPVKNLVDFVDYTLYCNDNTGNTNTTNNPGRNAENWTNCTPAQDCRILDMEWQMYRDKYLELKQKYYQIARNTTAYCGNSSVCAVGTPSSFKVSDCPAASEFVIQTNPLKVLYVGANPLNKPVFVNIYYPAEYSAIATTKTLTFVAGQKEIALTVDDAIPLNTLRIGKVSCELGFCEEYAVSKNISIVPLHLAGNKIEYTVKYSGPVSIPAGKTIYVTVEFRHPSLDIPYHPQFTFTNSSTSVVYGPLDLTNNIEYTPVITIIDCLPPDATTPPASSCDEAYLYKRSRITNISYDPLVITTDTIALKALADAQFAAGISTNCEAQADNWMSQLTACLSGVSETKRGQIRAKLIAVCKLGADINHPNGSSTTAGGVLTTDGYNSFSQVIKGELNLTAFTAACNPWLMDAPYPYDTKAQAVTNIIRRTNSEICARLATLTQQAGATPLYQYLVDKYGAAMNLTADELLILQKGCVNCRYLLAKDLTLPVFLDGTAKGCVSPAEFNQGLTALQQQPWLQPEIDGYETIYTTFLNHRWGLTLSYADYKSYADFLTANSGTTVMLCNLPVYAAVKPDPYSCLMELMDDAVSRGRLSYKEYITEIRRTFRRDYIAYCGAVKPKLNLTAAQQLYHYTLYYYDQAGNLVRTVPPEGVHLVDASLFASIDSARIHSGDACTYNDALVNKDKPTALQKLTTALQSTTNVAMEMWLYNPSATGSQVLATTGNKQFLINTCIDGSLLHFDTYTLAPAADGLSVDATLSRHTSVDLQAVLPLKQWTHVVIQGTGLNNDNRTVYVNGKLCPPATNAPPGNCGWEIASTPTGIIYPENLSALKHLRLYDKLLSAAEIKANTGVSCLSISPLNVLFPVYWGRFNIPAADGGTTVGDGSTTETQYSAIYPAHTLTTSYAYHSLNGIRLQNSPDAGNSQFYYDRLARLFASRNDAQWIGTYKKYSYTTYDALGRINEVGENSYANLGEGEGTFYESSDINFFLTNGLRGQITHTYYDEPYTGLSLTQENLRKRVSAVTYQDTNNGGPQQATYYSYDQIGNVKTLWQQIEGLETKKIDYQYDLVSGKVNKVGYQRGNKDKFYYGYQYDAENRLTKAYTATDVLAGNDWEVSNAKTDASYRYNLHGPLARMELGNTELIQGLDYAYTLQGWLKGVNGQFLSPDNEMGKDGLAGNDRAVIGRDVYAYSLDYFNGDYKPIGNNNAFAISWTPGETTEIGTNLYNGNISRSTLALGTFSPVGYSYRYDQLNRLTSMRQHALGSAAPHWDASSAGDAFKENVSYDGNGNILNYYRNGSGAGGKQALMDNLTYHYSHDASGNLLNNKLLHVKDAVTDPNYTEDLKTQGDNNYLYDQIGNLITDVQAGISNIEWTVYGKIKRITKSDGSLEYGYDASGNRVYKAYTHGGVTDKTWYVRDAQGNTLAIYGNKGGGTDLYWKEQHLYGSSRLGIWEPDLLSGSESQTAWGAVGKKRYELTNHLGNVLATISDKSLSVSGHYEADLLSAQDYYPFGMQQPDRSYTLGTYRYGFNGQEKSDEINNNSYTAEFWQYDARIGRRWNRDPITKIGESPYSALGNSPTILMDPNGADTINITRTNTRRIGPTMTSGLDNVPSRKIPDVMSTSVSVGIKTADGNDVFNLTDVNVTIDENGEETSSSTTSTLNLNNAQSFYRTGGHNAKGYLDDRYALAANAPTWLLQYYANKSGDIGIRSALAYQRDIPFTSKLNKIANIAFLAMPGEGFAIEKIEGFYLRSASTLSNGVFEKTIQTLAYMGENGSGSMLKLVTAIENQARSAGASTLEIHGIDIVNAKILSTTKAAAEKFGYSFEQVSSNSIKLTKVLK